MPVLSALPIAKIRQLRRLPVYWWLPVLALLGAVALFYQAWSQQGIPVILHFANGHGLKTGDALRYRGIHIGQVASVTLSDDLQGVQVALRVQASARAVLRAGSRFWIVRARLDASGASGLETLVGANYLSVLPGDGAAQREFVGLEEPPYLALMNPGGLTLTLRSPSQGMLQPGAPVSYRQVVVGRVLHVALARDASAVDIQVYIEPAYQSLIRDNTQFWAVSGARLEAGWLSGISLQIEPMQNLVMGGIALAVPPVPGKPALAGQRFTLAERAEAEWLSWTPHLLSEEALSAVTQPTVPLRASLSWASTRYWDLWRSPQKTGWLIPVATGLLGPADLLQIPDTAKTGSAQLALAGQTLTLSTAATLIAPGLALLPTAHTWPVWPTAQQRHPSQPEAVLLLSDQAGEALSIEATELQTVGADWQSARLPTDSHYHGAPVVAVRDGALLGLCLVESGQARLVLLPEQPGLAD